MIEDHLQKANCRLEWWSTSTMSQNKISRVYVHPLFLKKNVVIFKKSMLWFPSKVTSWSLLPAKPVPMVVLATIFPQQIPFQWQRTGGPGVHWVINEWGDKLPRLNTKGGYEKMHNMAILYLRIRCWAVANLSFWSLVYASTKLGLQTSWIARRQQNRQYVGTA